MIYEERIQQLIKKPYLYGIISAEDIYWVTAGYFSVIESYLGNTDLFKQITLDINQKFPLFSKNWGIQMRLISQDKKDSFLKFEQNVLPTVVNIIRNVNPDKRQKINIFSELLVQKIDEYKIDDVLQLQKFLMGFDLAYIDYEISDDDYNVFKQNTSTNNEKILNIFKLPIHLNAVMQIYARYYPNVEKGIEFFLKEYEVL